MKSDLDRLMSERGLQALIIAGDEGYNPPRCYLTNGARVTGGLVIKKVGEPPVMIVNPMEVEEAASSGLKVYSNNEMGWVELFKQADHNVIKTTVAFWGRCLEQLGVASGKVGVYGSGDIGFYLELLRLLEKAFPQYQFAGEMGTTLFDAATITKDDDELARIRSVARRTSAVLQATWDFIGSHRAEGDTVVGDGGAPLKIGDVRRFVRKTLLEHGLEDTGMIFAQGRDGGFPHSRGDDAMDLKLGQAIVFDLFPREIGGGYHHDVTRTWCIGHAPDEVQQVYHSVMEAFDIAVEAYTPGKPTHLVQEAVQDYFESKGHPTLRSHPGTTIGYTHSLGHGVGLKVHERPKLTHTSKEDAFQTGNVITIEPGLYYPEKGYGVRVEDMFYVAQDGQLVPLTDFHRELVLPLRA